MPSRRDLNGGEQRWVEVEPLLFQAEESDELVAFGEDGEGRITYLSGEASPANVVYEKVAAYKAPPLHLGLLAGGLVMFLLTALAWPLGAVISRWYERRDRKLHGKPDGEKPGRVVGAARLARPLAWAVSALVLLFVAGMALVFSNPEEALFYGDSPLLVAVLTLPFPVAALTMGVLIYAALAWTRRYWGLFGRLHYALVALSALAFVALLGCYSLLGFQF